MPPCILQCRALRRGLPRLKGPPTGQRSRHLGAGDGGLRASGALEPSGDATAVEGARSTAIPVAANSAVQVTSLAAVAAGFFLWLAAAQMAGWCGGSCGSDRQDSSVFDV